MDPFKYYANLIQIICALKICAIIIQSISLTYRACALGYVRKSLHVKQNIPV